MLNKLSIKNYAIIDRIEINFSNELNIITGETGAGKSILVGALSLLLGQRADAKTLFHKNEKCVIEGTFDISTYHLQTFFETFDLDYDPQTILRREITIDGKSRAFINDTPVTLTVLKNLGEHLVDIHSQNETSELNSELFQLMVVDSFCEHAQSLKNYRQTYALYKKRASELEKLKEATIQSQNEIDYLQFQYNELKNAQIIEDEQESLESELQRLTHAEEIKKNLTEVYAVLEGNESAVQTQLRTIISQIHALEKYHEAIPPLAERLHSTFIEIKDLSSEIEALASKTVLDQERIQLIQERLDLLYRLQQKHRVNNNKELLLLVQEIEAKLNSFASADNEILEIEKEVKVVRSKCIELSKSISIKRGNVLAGIESKIQKLLSEVGMPHAQLKIEHKIMSQEEFTSNGIDRICFLFSANKGYPLTELHKVASGGELSRLMLCIKSLIAQFSQLPTIIFDEIDTGVSGEIALKIGNIMEKLAASMQVISITHLPQIASKGSSHFYVYKETQNGQTFTKIKQLEEDERVVEIAKMISGDKPTVNAMKNAKELLNSEF